VVFSIETDKKAANIVTAVRSVRIMAGCAVHPSGLIVLRFTCTVPDFFAFFFSVFSFEKIFWKGKGKREVTDFLIQNFR